jgi:hypothetical protein
MSARPALYLLLAACLTTLGGCIVETPAPRLRAEAAWVPGHYNGWHWEPGHWEH